MTCIECRYRKNSQCYRYPPGRIGHQPVNDDDWCGEFMAIPPTAKMDVPVTQAELPMAKPTEKKFKGRYAQNHK